MSSTITFEAGSTTTVTNFSLAGTANNLTTINSSIQGTQFTLYKSSGTVSTDYLSIEDSNATGASWYAGANSVNVNNNTGWLFMAAPATGPINGQFFSFF